jgi:phage/plasmid-associated DNA primase
MSKRAPSTTTASASKRQKRSAPKTTKFEVWDRTLLRKLISLVDIKDETRAVLAKINAKVSGDKLEVGYRPSKMAGFGRLYGFGLQGVPGWIRRVMRPHDKDIDIKNCAPSFWVQVAERELGPGVAPHMRHYVENREKVLTNELGNLSRSQAKEAVLTILHLGQPDDDDRPYYRVLSAEVKKVTQKLMKLDKFAPLIQRLEELGKPNPMGTFNSWIYQVPEAKSLEIIDQFFEAKGRPVTTLVFDGLLVQGSEGEPPLPTALLRGAELLVKQRTGLVVELVEKPHQPRAKDLERLKGDREPDTDTKGFALLTSTLAEHGRREKLSRFADAVFGTHASIPGALEQRSEAAEFINRVLLDVDEFHARPVMAALLTWFQTQDHADFPLLTQKGMDHKICAFTNGQLDIAEMKFTETVEMKNAPVPTFWYFDQAYSEEKKDTPLWDCPLSTQIAPEEKKEDDNTREDPIFMLEALIGRLFHPVGRFDRWSVMLFVLGDANTGKSTILQLVSKMFPVGSVANISANHEKQFGLEKLVNARLILCMDLPKDMCQVLSQTEWQSCVSGEYVSVPRKNKVALSVPEWSAPFFWAGNSSPNYRDNAGSASRRLATYRFETVIAKRDTMLVAKVLDTELVAIMLRCLTRYHDLRERRAGQDFWKFAPMALVEQRDRASEETNYLANFVANGDNFYDCVFEEGAVTPLALIKKAFTNHMQFNHADVKFVWSSDYHALRSRGFVIKRSYLCKVCPEIASLALCGDHYNAGKNRKQVTVVHNLRIKRKDEGGAY